MRRVTGVGVVVMFFLYITSAEAQVIDMALTVQSAPSITTSGGEVILPENSESHQFEAESGGTFNFVNPDGSSVTIIFFIGTTQVTLDFFIDSYDQAAITADRPLPTGRNVVGSLIYDMRTFEGSTSTTTFDNPFSMTIHYPEEQLGGLNEDTLGIYFWDESQSIWTAFDVDSRNIEQNTITILSDHLTFFATLGEVKEAAPSGGDGSSGGGGGGGGAGGGGGGGGGATGFFVASSQCDIVRDGVLDILDFNLLMVHWGEAGPGNIADCTSDNVVDIFDFNLLMVNWST